MRELVECGRKEKAREEWRHGTAEAVLQCIADGCEDPSALAFDALAVYELARNEG